jgi:hypothetical protein
MEYDDVTKKVCLCSFLSLVLIILFIITPLSNFVMTSNFMKVIILVVLAYTIYLNHRQTNSLKLSKSESPEISMQLDINVKCSYVFTFFLGLLFIFVVRSLLF